MPRKPKLDHRLVIRMYVDEKLGAYLIAKALGTSSTQVYSVLKAHNIPRRSRREAQRLRNYESIVDDKNLRDSVIPLYCEKNSRSKQLAMH